MCAMQVHALFLSRVESDLQILVIYDIMFLKQALFLDNRF